VGENGESHHKVTYTLKDILVKKERMMPALPCYKERGLKKKKNIYDIKEKNILYKKGRKEVRGGFSSFIPLLLTSRSMSCV
jgi:hypothetical protein